MVCTALCIATTYSATVGREDAPMWCLKVIVFLAGGGVMTVSQFSHNNSQCVLIVIILFSAVHSSLTHRQVKYAQHHSMVFGFEK